MKPAFSLLELVVSVVILGVFFANFSLFFKQNERSLNSNFAKIYELESEIYENKGDKKIISLTLWPLNSSINLLENIAKEESLELKGLNLSENLSYF